jgi:3-oxoacyl-[acyl-carrier protein] reductase
VEDLAEDRTKDSSFAEADGAKMKIKDKVAVVTGASKDIGRGVAVKFAKEGAAVVLASRTMNLLQKAVSEINEAGG